MAEGVVYVVDDDAAVRDGLKFLIESVELEVAPCANAQAFLDAYDQTRPGCLVLDVRLRGMSGLDLQAELARRAITIPTIIVTGHGDVPMAVSAMKAGAVDFLEKPFDETTLLDSIRRAIELSQASQRQQEEVAVSRQRIDELTPREREVMLCLAQGKQNKVVALELGISPRTVEIHRARVMEKMAARSVSDIVRAAISMGLL